MKKIKILMIICLSFLMTSISCTDDLNTEPRIQQSLADLLENDPDAIKGILARLYGGFVLHGTGVPGSDDQQADLDGPDPGETPTQRALWNLQEMTTDIVKNRWGDGGLDPLTTTTGWASTNKFFGYMYNRIYFQVAQVNNFLVETGPLDFEDKARIRAEARFIRAIFLYYSIDLFGDTIIITEEEGIGGPAVPRSPRAEAFEYVVNELNAIRDLIPVKSASEYGRANRATIDMLLAKLYLNAEVYTGTPAYDKALQACTDVIASDFSLDDNYQSIFQGDNFDSPEIIFPIVNDSENIQSFGGTTYLVNGSYSRETMDIAKFGAQDAWTGHRCTQTFHNLFGDLNPDSEDTSIDSPDKRAIFHSRGHNPIMKNYRQWTDGYPTTKFRNTFASDPDAGTFNFSSTDFPIFRLADAYLMYAEAHLRGGGGDVNTAVGYINALRERAYGNTSGNISLSDLNLDFIIDERARELYYEAHRRQDLIRFGLFTGGNYKWAWKGGTENGTSIPSTYKLFPIPLEAIQSSPVITQNPGY